MAGFELLITMTRDPEARPRLVATVLGDGIDRRRAAIALLERLDMADQIDWHAAYVLDLEQEDTCARRKEAVAKLRALGDARAISALDAAITRKGKTGKWKGKPVNACLADDARAAIAYLRDLAVERDAGNRN
jgi:hypothetical protein